MPTVPRYERRVTQDAGPTLRNETRLQEGAFQAPGAALEAAVQGAQRIDYWNQIAENRKQRQIAQLEKAAREKANKVFVREAEAKYIEWQNQNLYDAENGLAAKQGKNAMNALPVLDENFNELSSELKTFAALPEQQDALRELEIKYRSKFDRFSNKHVLAESQRLTKDTYEGHIKGKFIAAARNWNDLEEASTNVFEAVKVKLEQLKETGVVNPDDPKSKENVEQILRDTATKGFMPVIKALVDNGQEVAAKTLLEQQADWINPEEAAEAKQLIKEYGRLGKAFQAVDEVLQRPGIGRLEAKEGIRKKIKDPELRKEAMGILEAEISQRELARREAQSNNLVSAANIVEKNPSLAPQKSVPPSLWQTLTPSQRRSLGDIISRKETDPTAWLDMMEAVKKNPNAINNMTRGEFVEKYWSKFSPADRKKAEKLWTDRQEPQKISTSSTVTFQQQLERQLNLAGLITESPRSLSKKQRMRYDSFRRQVESDLFNFETNIKKGRASQEERERIIQNAINDTVTVEAGGIRGFFGATEELPASMVTDEEIPIEGIPESRLNQYRQEFEAMGKPVTDDNLEEYHRLNLQGDSDAAYEFLTN